MGKAGAPHGVKGEIRVIPLTDFPQRFHELKQVYFDTGKAEITACRSHKQFIILKLKGCDDRDTAAAYTGKLLYIERSAAVPLDEGEYYTFDIVGLQVLDTAGNVLGEVTDVLRTGSNDVYAVKNQENGRELMVPALKKIVQEINLEQGTMTVKLPEEA